MVDLNIEVPICEINEKFWNIKREYVINLLTKQIRNTRTGRIEKWGTTSAYDTEDQRIGVFKEDGKMTSLRRNIISKYIRNYIMTL